MVQFLLKKPVWTPVTLKLEKDVIPTRCWKVIETSLEFEGAS